VAWESLNTLGTVQDKTADASDVLTTTAAAEAGNVVVLVVALDNLTGNPDADNGEVTSITDSAGGNTWTKAKEWTNAQGGAAAGATVSVWFSKLTNAIASGGTIPANFTGSPAAVAMSAWEFSIGAGNVVTVEGSAVLADDGIDLGNMSIGGLPNREYLFFRGIASETNNIGQITVTGGFIAISLNQTSGAGAASNMAVRGEFRIFTNDSEASNPFWVSADHASVFVALKEASDVVLPPRPTIVNNAPSHAAFW